MNSLPFSWSLSLWRNWTFRSVQVKVCERARDGRTRATGNSAFASPRTALLARARPHLAGQVGWGPRTGRARAGRPPGPPGRGNGQAPSRRRRTWAATGCSASLASLRFQLNLGAVAMATRGCRHSRRRSGLHKHLEDREDGAQQPMFSSRAGPDPSARHKRAREGGSAPPRSLCALQH
ncbi:PREDICTED: uncharacterized protein LOC102011313 isoform X8 [Chinchilla lanigera]|uniref:uncharacterized protein LOC102011313 isoform X8 n=1 Tax=Chinchilla lanigera TaxID=34839 RepID=UPI0006962478|nr:PREDICTED: uncharacterized protein LOC102011313 isoform X8 [Chinchilla lanigera]